MVATTREGTTSNGNVGGGHDSKRGWRRTGARAAAATRLGARDGGRDLDGREGLAPPLPIGRAREEAGVSSDCLVGKDGGLETGSSHGKEDAATLSAGCGRGGGRHVPDRQGSESPPVCPQVEQKTELPRKAIPPIPPYPTPFSAITVMTSAASNLAAPDGAKQPTTKPNTAQTERETTQSTRLKKRRQPKQSKTAPATSSILMPLNFVTIFFIKSV